MREACRITIKLISNLAGEIKMIGLIKKAKRGMYAIYLLVLLIAALMGIVVVGQVILSI